MIQPMVFGLLGAVAGLGQAPYGLAIALLLCCATVFALLPAARQPKMAALWGWAFGTGYFAHTLFWIMEPFQVDAAQYGWMAPFALFFMAAGLALFWAAAFALARWVSCHSWPLLLTLTATEVARAYLFTGFPWAGLSQSMIDGSAARLLAYVGPHGATCCLLAVAWVLSLTPQHARRTTLRFGQACLLGLSAVALELPDKRAAAPLTDHTVRLIQPNAPQHLKWQPDMVPVFYVRQLELTAAPSKPDTELPALIVWPETAVPWPLDTAATALAEIAQAAGETPVVLGMLRWVDGRLRNSLVVIDAQGKPTAIYDKHHLVPFGEYLPFAPLARRLGLRGLADARGPGFSAGPGPALLNIADLGQAIPLICYEAVFAHDVAKAPGRGDYLLQITNDAWFGAWAGPQQHLAQARMRAIEQGLPLMRAANTGISAMIDPYGRVIASLKLYEAGFLDAPLPRPLPPTLYSRSGDTPLTLGLVAILALLIVRKATQKKPVDLRGKTD